jgi:hypothetical protein
LGLGGGGGGGGYEGGGGGGDGNGDAGNSAGGGGGGSSILGSGATPHSFSLSGGVGRSASSVAPRQAGVQVGNGRIVLTFNPAAAPIEASPRTTG